MARTTWIGDVGLGGLGIGIGAGIGAGLMYWLDPDRGQRRRSMARDKAMRQIQKLENVVERGLDAGDRMQEWASVAKPSSSELIGRPTAARVVTGVAGGALLAYGIVKRASFPRPLTLLGLGLLLQSITDRDVREIIAAIREYSSIA